MKLGTYDISKIYLGTAEISNIYLGTSQVYSGDTPTPPQCEPTYDTSDWSHSDVWEYVENDGSWPVMDGDTAIMSETICDLDASDAWDEEDPDWFNKMVYDLNGAFISLSATLNGNSVGVDWFYDEFGGNSYVRFLDGNYNQIGYAGTQYDNETGDSMIVTYDFVSGDWVWTLTYESGEPGFDWGDAE